MVIVGLSCAEAQDRGRVLLFFGGRGVLNQGIDLESMIDWMAAANQTGESRPIQTNFWPLIYGGSTAPSKLKVKCHCTRYKIVMHQHKIIKKTAQTKQHKQPHSSVFSTPLITNNDGNSRLIRCWHCLNWLWRFGASSGTFMFTILIRFAIPESLGACRDGWCHDTFWCTVPRRYNWMRLAEVFVSRCHLQKSLYLYF